VEVANALNDRIVKMSNDQCSYTRRIDELVLAYYRGIEMEKKDGLMAGTRIGSVKRKTHNQRRGQKGTFQGLDC
jgi:hypothetical protein